MSSIATQHRTGLTAAVAIAAALVIAGLIAGSSIIERVVPRLPEVPGIAIVAAFGFAVLIGLALLIAHSAAAAGTRARREALEAAFAGEVHCGIRNRVLVETLETLRRPETRATRLTSRFSIVADDRGVSFWTGGRRPRRVADFAWREVRSIRSDATVVGGANVPVALFRIRRAGSSIELPIVLSSERTGRYALSDAPFFAVLRSWKAKHRAALAAEGLELPPLTAPIPIIRSGRVAA